MELCQRRAVRGRGCEGARQALVRSVSGVFQSIRGDRVNTLGRRTRARRWERRGEDIYRLESGVWLQRNSRSLSFRNPAASFVKITQRKEQNLPLVLSLQAAAFHFILRVAPRGRPALPAGLRCCTNRTNSLGLGFGLLAALRRLL